MDHEKKAPGRFDWWILLLVGIMLLLFFVRIDFALSTPFLSHDSYLMVRNVEHIQETGLPLRDDLLSLTGHQRVDNPLFAYLLAFVTFVSPIAYKLLPNLLMVLLLIPVYLLARRLSKSSFIAILAVILAGTGPILFSQTLNTASAAPLGLLLVLTILALLEDIDKNIFLLIFCAIALAFTHPIIFVLALALLVMMLLLRVEGYGVDDRVNELFFFTVLLAVWFYVLVYKNAIFDLGIRVLWQNLPAQYLGAEFGSVSLLGVLYGLGTINFLFGTFGLYHVLFENRDRASYVIVAPMIAVAFLLAVRLLPLEIGIIILTPLFAIMAAYGIGVTVEYLRRTKMPRSVYVLAAVLVIFFVFSAVLPALTNVHDELQSMPAAEEVASYRLLHDLLPSSAVVLTSSHEAAAVQYFSGRATVSDTDFLLVDKPSELVNDIDSIYTAHFSITLLHAAEKLGFTHVLFSPVVARQYARDKIFIEESDCVKSTTVGVSLLYHISCSGVER